MALQNALYTGDLARLQELFPPHSTADLLLESRAAEPRWISHQRGEGRPGDTGLRAGGLGGPHQAQRYTRCLRTKCAPGLFLSHPEACLNLGPGEKSCGA